MTLDLFFDIVLLFSPILAAYAWFRSRDRLFASRILVSLFLIFVVAYFLRSGASIVLGLVGLLGVCLVLVYVFGWSIAGLLGLLGVYSFAFSDLVGGLSSIMVDSIQFVIVVVFLLVCFVYSRRLPSVLAVVAGLIVGLCMYVVSLGLFLEGLGSVMDYSLLYSGGVSLLLYSLQPRFGYLWGFAYLLLLGVYGGVFSGLATSLGVLGFLASGAVEAEAVRRGVRDWRVIGVVVAGLISMLLPLSGLAYEFYAGFLAAYGFALFVLFPVYVYARRGRLVDSVVVVAVEALVFSLLSEYLGVWAYTVLGLGLTVIIVFSLLGGRRGGLLLYGLAVVVLVLVASYYFKPSPYVRVVSNLRPGSKLNLAPNATCVLEVEDLACYPRAVSVWFLLRNCGAVFNITVYREGSLAVPITIYGWDCVVGVLPRPTAELRAKVFVYALLGECESIPTRTLSLDIVVRGVCGFRDSGLALAAVFVLAAIPLARRGISSLLARRRGGG